MRVSYNVKKSLFNDYDTVLFDLDSTIWDCFSPMGRSIPSLEMIPPFTLLDENTVKDSKNNILKLQENIKDVLENLDEYGLNLGVVSRSAVPELADEAQPAFMLLKKLDIYKFFNYIVVIKANINKADYARPDGKTLLIDDNVEQLRSVNQRGLVDVLNRHSFANWKDLFSESKNAKPEPTRLQTAVNAPQPTTSSLKFIGLLKFSEPLTYTDKSDIDAGIGGGARNKSDMWNMEDHLVLDNQRDHVWGEPWEPTQQYFLNEKVTPKVDDKIKQQHPDKGGIAISSLKFSDISSDLPKDQVTPRHQGPIAYFIQRLIDNVVYNYIQNHELYYNTDYKVDTEDPVTLLLPYVKKYLEPYIAEEGGKIEDYDVFIKDQIQDAVNYFTSMPYFYSEEKPKLTEEIKNDIIDKIHQFLVTKFNGDQFSVTTIVSILNTYANLPDYDEITPEFVEGIVKTLPTKYPESFSWNGNLIVIGREAKKSDITIDTNKLKEVALAPVDKFVSLGEVKNTPDGTYIFIDNGSNVLAVAHLDTVNDSSHFHVTTNEESRVIHNAQLDDRLGVYIILDLLPKLGINVDVLLTEGEEQGRSTARYFQPKKHYNWIFSFDRNGMDTVMYQYHDESTANILNNENFLVGKGSFSDITFMEHLGVKGFNFGVGYYSNHSSHESHAIESHVIHNIERFKQFYDKYKDVPLPHASNTSYYKRLSFLADNPKAEQYPDYMGNTDVSPLDPKNRDDKEREDSIRTDLQKMYYEWGTHETVMRPETDRPVTPFASLKFSDIMSNLNPKAQLTTDEDSIIDNFVQVSLPASLFFMAKHFAGATGRIVGEDKRFYRIEFDNEELRHFAAEHDLEYWYKDQVSKLSTTASFAQPIKVELHKPNSIMTHEAVQEALTFADSMKPRSILRHEVRDDYVYQSR